MDAGEIPSPLELKLSCFCSSKYFFLKDNMCFFWTTFTFWTWQDVVFVGVDSWKNIGESKRLFFVQTPQSEFRQRQGLVTVVQGSLLGSVLSNLLLAWISQFFFQEEVGGKVWMDRESLFLCLCFVLCVCFLWCLLFVLQNFSFNSNKKVVRLALEMKFLLPIYTQRLDELNEGFAYSSNLTTTVEDPPIYGTHWCMTSPKIESVVMNQFLSSIYRNITLKHHRSDIIGI